MQRIADDIVATIKSGGFEVPADAEVQLRFHPQRGHQVDGQLRPWKIFQAAQGCPAQAVLQLIRPYVSRVFLRRMTDAAVDKVVIVSSRARGKNEEIVKTSVKFTDGRPDLPISWRLRRKGGGFKVIDLLVAGVSMIKAQRDEFTAQIRKNNGDVASLLKYMGG